MPGFMFSGRADMASLDWQSVELDGGVRDMVPRSKAIHQPHSSLDDAAAF